MDERTVAFYIALSHTSLGLVPLVAALLLGAALVLLHRRRRELSERWTLPTILLLWPLFLFSVGYSLAALAHVGCSTQVARHTLCQGTMKELGIAAMQYAQNHHDTLPSAENWERELQPYLKKSVKCPSVKVGTGYALNKNLSKKKLDAIDYPGDTVLFFETDNGTEVTKRRHGGVPHFVFADGHAKGYREQQMNGLHWK